MRPMPPGRMAAAILATAMMLAACISAGADEIRVTSSNALKPVLEQIAPQFESATGHKLVFTWGQADILKGASFDVAVLTSAVIDKLIMQGRLVGASRTAVAASAAGLAVRKGAAKPDIGTVESFKRTLLDAKSITFAEQGGTGAYLKALFMRLGIADALAGKFRPLRPRQGPAEAVAGGEAEMALTQISEILPYAGVELVGPLPSEVQVTTTYVAAVGVGTPHRDAVVALIKLLTAPAAAPVLRAKGLDPAGVAPAQPASSPELHWSACRDVPDTECAGLEVPVDPARPYDAKFTLRLGRVPATDPARKKGVLLFIPGGPGVGISGVFGQLRGLQHIDDFARHFDVVSFDPRGIGESSPVRCNPDALPPASEPIYQPPTPIEFETLARANAAFFQSCFTATGELMRHLSAIDTAADIEQIRQALSPDGGLVAYAGSYGTVYGAAYLERYGDHIKALVLDAVVDHSIDLATMVTRNILSVADAFDRFAQWCGREKACALHDQDLGKTFDMVAVTTPVLRTLVPQLLSAGSDPNLGWPALAQMLAEASRGDTSTLDKLTKAASIGSSSAADPWVVAGESGLPAGVQCSDFGPQHDYAALLAAGAAVADRTPRFAWRFWDAAPVAHSATGVGDCVGWPVGTTNPPHRLQVGSHPNVMVASPTHDPATPLINALSLWLQIPDARLLIADVDGHQSLAWSRCAFDAQLRFLLDPTSVSATTLCPN